MSETPRKPWDFFISYASEDRETAATPLTNALTHRGFAVWLDQKVLTSTARLEDQIQQGLTNCHCGIVTLSPNFIRKDWPMRELDSLFGIETLDGRHRIVPLLHNITAVELREMLP